HLCMITGCRDNWQNVKHRHFYFTIMQNFTFCRISRHPVIVQRCTIAHSNRLNATIRMSYSASPYNHWMPRYSAKRKILHNRKMKMPMFDVLPNISASSDRTEMHNSSFKSSHYDDSNEL